MSDTAHLSDDTSDSEIEMSVRSVIFYDENGVAYTTYYFYEFGDFQNSDIDEYNNYDFSYSMNIRSELENIFNEGLYLYYAITERSVREE